MYVDSELLLSDGQGPFTADAWSSNKVDLSVARNIAKGKPLYVVVVVDETFDGGTSLIISVCTDSAPAFDSGAPIYHISTDDILQGALTAGREPIVIPISQIGADRRYLALRYNETGAFTDGTVTAYVTSEP